MHPNEAIIENFYKAFSRGDWAAMQNSYHDEAVFFDPAFQNLNARQVKAMWQMLLSRSKDLKLQYHSVKADDEYGDCKWVAEYTFAKTGRKVVNHISAHFKFHEGKIIEHMDDFSMWRWSRQALGISGWLLGWSGIIRNKVSTEARKQLDLFMRRYKLAADNDTK